MREALKIKKAKLDENIKHLNRDKGNLLSTITQLTLFVKMKKTDAAPKSNQEIADVKWNFVKIFAKFIMLEIGCDYWNRNIITKKILD